MTPHEKAIENMPQIGISHEIEITIYLILFILIITIPFWHKWITKNRK